MRQPLETTPTSRPSRRKLGLEMLAVFVMAVAPLQWQSIGFFLVDYAESPAWYSGISYTFMALAVVFPLLYWLHVSHGSLEAFGIRRLSWRQIGVGVLAGGALILIIDMMLYPALYYAAPDLWQRLMPSAEQTFGPSPAGLAWMAWGFGMLAAPLMEEVVMRGYFVTRLSQFFRNELTGILLSAIIFGSYHIYQGALAAVVATFSGIALGLLFLATRSIWPCVIAHWIGNGYAFYSYFSSPGVSQ